MRQAKDINTELFICLLSTNQRKIYSFVLSAVARQSIAEEIMQQTLLEMWRDFAHFKEGTNFAAWGKEIAKYEIYNYRKKRAREFILDMEALAQIIEVTEKEDNSDQRMMALKGCIEKLNDKHRQLIYDRYHQALSCTMISEKINRPVATVYKTFARLHITLRDCVSRTLSVWKAEA